MSEWNRNQITMSDLLGLGLSPSTAYQYARVLDVAIGYLEERGTDLLCCRPADVAEITQRFKNTYPTRSRLRAALLAGWEILERYDGPAKAVRVPPRPRARCKALPEAAAVALEQTAWDLRDVRGLAVLVGLYAALRRFEIAKLAWQDIRLDPYGRPEWIYVQGKGDIAGEVPIHPVLAKAFEPHIRREGWMFPGQRHGSHVSPATIWEYVRQVAELAGIGKIRTHQLRHTALAEANDRTGNLRAVQEFARHSKPEMTAGYTRVLARQLKDVVNSIDYGRAG